MALYWHLWFQPMVIDLICSCEKTHTILSVSFRFDSVMIFMIFWNYFASLFVYTIIVKTNSTLRISRFFAFFICSIFIFLYMLTKSITHQCFFVFFSNTKRPSFSYHTRKHNNYFATKYSISTIRLTVINLLAFRSFF